nr:PfkB family carbohydrate kinase [Verrucomicrobium spinosum]
MRHRITFPPAREVYDVSGAGDTAIAVLTMALASGLDPVQAADVANHASGIVVGKLGTACVTPEELRAAYDS